MNVLNLKLYQFFIDRQVEVIAKEIPKRYDQSGVVKGVFLRILVKLADVLHFYSLGGVLLNLNLLFVLVTRPIPPPKNNSHGHGQFHHIPARKYLKTKSYLHQPEMVRNR